MLMVLVVFNSSCKKDEITAHYIGKWMTVKSIPGTSGYVSVNYSLTLTDHTFTETFLTNVGRYPQEVLFVTINGSVSVSAERMKLITHKISFSKYNSSISVVSDPYETYAFEDDDFEFNFEHVGTSTSNNNLEYEVIENQLIVKVDYNRDGIFSEIEKSIYIKQ